jgi:hypothetical protein
MEGIVGVLGLLFSAATYFIGVKRGERHERERREHEVQLEAGRRLRELASKAADEYVRMARTHYDAGPHALASLSLDLLGSSALIEEAIREMHLRSGSDPWGGSASHVQGLDLVAFFRHVREQKIDFFSPVTTVEEVARRVREGVGT